jgi:hypothetical protein
MTGGTQERPPFVRVNVKNQTVPPAAPGKQ